MRQQLTMGPILFNWKPDVWRDFYYRIADESPVDTVYIGEVVCSKRASFFEPFYSDVTERLISAGKTVIFSTLAEIMIKRERKMVESICSMQDFMVEANDAAALYHLHGKPHAAGFFLNVYNEETLEFLARSGAKHFTLPAELPAEAISVLAAKAAEMNVTTEVMVYGRIPLALSARCYHARAHDRVKDNCQFICEEDPDGMGLNTLDGEAFLIVNGVQTMSYKYLNLVQEIEQMSNWGVSAFRLSPHSHDMVKVSKIFRSLLDKEIDSPKAEVDLLAATPNISFSNGFFHRQPGYDWVNMT